MAKKQKYTKEELNNLSDDELKEEVENFKKGLGYNKYFTIYY
tara:strand:+ start:191 stop:316 length:126 start_codon:yes stop_codon:yes gene_type:complete